jgi:hypothetical protein
MRFLIFTDSLHEAAAIYESLTRGGGRSVLIACRPGDISPEEKESGPDIICIGTSCATGWHFYGPAQVLFTPSFTTFGNWRAQAAARAYDREVDHEEKPEAFRRRVERDLIQGLPVRSAAAAESGEPR